MDETHSTTNPDKPRTGQRSTLLIVFLVVFIDLLGFGIVLPLLPLYAVDFLQPLFPGEVNRPLRGMAMIGAAFGIGFTFSPLLGFASLFVPLKGAPGFAAALFSLMALLLAIRLLPETLRPGGQLRPRRWIDWGGLQTALRIPSV